MSKKQGRRIKLSKNLVPFVSRVVRDGPSQRNFAAAAAASNACVKSALGGKGKKNNQTPLTGKFVHDEVIRCQKAHFPKKTVGPAPPAP